MRQNCNYTDPYQYNHPTPERQRRPSRHPVPPFFGNAHLSKETDRLTRGYRGSQDVPSRKRRLTVSADLEQTSLPNPNPGSMSASTPNQVMIGPGDEPRNSRRLRSFKNHIVRLSSEERTCLTYDTAGPSVSNPSTDRLTQQTESDSQNSPAFSRGSSSSTLQDSRSIRTRARRSSQNSDQHEGYLSSGEETLVSDTPSDSEPLYLPHPSGPYLNPNRSPNRNPSTQRRTPRLATPVIQHLRTLTISEPGPRDPTLLPRILKADPSTNGGDIRVKKPTITYFRSPSPHTAQIETASPIEPQQQDYPGPETFCSSRACPIGRPHPAGTYGVPFYPTGTVRIHPPEIISAKTRVDMIECGEEFQLYRDDVMFLERCDEGRCNGQERHAMKARARVEMVEWGEEFAQFVADREFLARYEEVHGSGEAGGEGFA